MGVFDQINSGSSSPSSGGVFGKLKQVENIQNVASFKQGEQQFGAPFQDPSNSSFMRQANQNNAENHSPQPNESVFAKIGHILNYPFAKAAELSIPDAPMFSKDGGLSDINAREQFAKENPIPSTGNKTLDNIGDIAGNIGSFFVPTGGGALSIAESPAIQSLASKLGSKLSANIENKSLQKAVNVAGNEAVKFAPQNAQYMATSEDQTSVGGVFKNLATGAAMGAGFGAVGSLAGSAIGKAVERFANKSQSVAPEAEQATQQTLSNYSKPLTNPQPLDSVMQDIHQEVSQRITPPLENPKLLDQYLQLHLGEDVPKSEISALSYNDKADLAKHIQDNLSVHDVATQVANEKGYNWNALSGQTDSVKPTSEAIPNEINPINTNTSTMQEPQVAKLSDMRKSADQVAASVERPISSDLKAPTKSVQNTLPKDELKLAETIRNSPTTPPDIVKALEAKPIVGARTNDVKDLQEAGDMIKKHGVEGMHSLLMNKTKQFSSAENVASKIISDHFGLAGGEENLNKALDLIAKTAKGGREMGQAISAFRQWKQLDSSGALLLGTRQLNKDIKDIRDYKTLTPAQGATITKPAERIVAADVTKSLADQVEHIIMNKKSGELLTDAEKATIQQFNDKVKEINSKTKPFLPQEKGSKANATIKEVSQIEPKARTRDQVVSFLDAKAMKARERLAASRNKISSTPLEIYADYAIVGASHLARGAVKFADFSERMIREFGDSIKPHLEKIFKQSEKEYNSSKTMTLYHGSDHTFDTFKPNKAQAGEGVFLTDNSIAAKEYGKNIYKVEVQPNKIAHDKEWSQAVDALKQENKNKMDRLENKLMEDMYNGKITRQELNQKMDDAEKMYQMGDSDNPDQNAKVSAYLKRKGYDIYEGNMQSGDKGKEYLVLDQSIIKSNSIENGISSFKSKTSTALDNAANAARERLKNSRNTLSANPLGQYTDYAIIGASHIAKGIFKLSDFTEQMVKDFGKLIEPHVEEIYQKATNIFRKENGLPTVQELDKVVRNAIKNDRFTAEEANHFKAWANEIGFYADKNMKTEAVQDLQAAMKDLGESTLGQKLATLQTGAQLLNPVTVGRNVIGNVALISYEKINKVAAVPIDWALSKLTGERTIQWLPKTQEKMLSNFMMGTESGWKGVSPTGTLDSYGIHPNVFGKNNYLKYVAKSLGASMQGFDFAAYRVAYGDVLATYGEQLGKAQGLTKAEIRSQMPQLIEKLDQRIHDLADEAGRYATFQDDTILSQGAEMLKRGLNKVTDFPVQKMVEKGLLPKKLSTEGFGAGDVVLKYAKTPANLIMRAIDYSPLGFVRATMELAPLVVNRSKFNQFQATRALSRAITGTLGLTGMGYVLADAGILTGSSSMDKDVRSIQEQSGQGAYKVNWSALGRFFTSGFDKEAAKFQTGDKLMDYAWLQPAAISLAMGVNAQKAVTNLKNGTDTNGWQAAGKAVLGGIQTVLENPMVQGISSVIDAGSDIVKKQDPTKLINIAKGVPASFVPTLLSQARTATDNKQRETFDKNVFVEIGNLMANKVPGLSKNLPISYDSLGNAREKIQGGQENTVPQALTSFFSPAKMTEYQVSPEAKLALDIMNQSGDANVLPRIVGKSFHVSQGKQLKDLKVGLNKEQFSQLQQETGQLVTQKLSQYATMLSDPNRSLQSKVDKVKSILSDVGKKAREDVGVQMGFQKSKIKS